MIKSIIYINEREDIILKYLERLDKIRKGKYIKFNSIEDLRKITN